MPIIHSKPPLLGELVKRVNCNLQTDNTDIEDDDDDYSSDEDEFDVEVDIWMKLQETYLLTVYLFKTKKTFYYAYLNFVLKLEARQNLF